MALDVAGQTRNRVLHPEQLTALAEFGRALTEGLPLRVHNEGIVAIDRDPPLHRAKENSNERQGTTGSAAGPRQGPSGRQGPARGPRPPRAPARLGRGDLQAAYEDQLAAFGEAYPDHEVHADQDGLWLLVRSRVIPGLDRKAAFLIALPFEPATGPRAWGFWIVAGEQPRWIGPRHINFHEGSICAFSPDDGAWSEGGDLRTLVDLYTVWALRHLHLEAFGRWPGRQYALSGAPPAVQAFYRRTECRDNELCGCGSTTLQYRQCCKPADVALDFAPLASVFLKAVPGGFATRKPPPPVLGFMLGNAPLPRIRDVHLQLHAESG